MILSNTNGMNILIKKQRVRLDLKSNTQIPEMLQIKRHSGLRVKKLENVYNINTNLKKLGVTMLISYTVDFRVKNVTR